MKTWQTVTVTALATLGLAGAGVFVYTSNQPAHYEGTTFKSSTSSSSSSSSSSLSTEESSSSYTEESSTNTVVVEKETKPLEKYTSTTAVYTNNGYFDYSDNLITRQGFYILYYGKNGDYTKNYYTVIQLTAENQNIDSVYVYGNDNSDAWVNASDFVKWLRQQAPDGTTQNGLQANYNYWLKNVKG